MLNFFANILMKVGEFVVQTGNIGCVLFLIMDEPDCPKSLIK